MTLVSADFIGILDTVDVPIVVVGRDCTLIHINRAATEALGLAPADIGSLPGDVAALADVKDFAKLCAQVIAEEVPCRREIQNGDRRFLLRLAPYRGRGDNVEGAVITFTNVTAFRASIEQAIYEREYTKAILNTVIDPIVVLDSDLRVQTGNRAFYSMFGASRDGSQGVPLRDLGSDEWKTSGLWTSLKATAVDGEFQPLEIERDFPAIGRRTVVFDARRLTGHGEQGVLLTIHDVTDRKRSEAAAAKLAAIVESSDDAIISKDLAGTITSWNQGAERLFGYTAREAIGQSILILIPDDRLDEERNILDRIRRGERIEHFETIRLRKDGTPLDISLTVSPIADPSGQIVGASKTARNITERVLAKKALQDSERRFREMIDALPAAVYTTNAQGRLTHFNPACVALSGRTPEIGGDQWCVTWKLYHRDGTPMAHDECPMAIALKEGRSVRGDEAIAERPDGTRIWFMPHPTPFFDTAGRVVGGINMLVDITERKHAEEVLRASEQRFRTLFDSMDEGYCVIEMIFDKNDQPVDYRFLQINPAFEKQTGIKDAQGRLMREIAPGHEQHWFDVYGRIAVTGETQRFENSAAALGRFYDVCAFRVGPPELRRVGIVFNDITERKKAEEVIRQSQKALLEEDKRKDEFLATLAHELRNPLAPIRNSLQILRMTNGSNPAAERVQEMMERQVAHMVRLVDDLLELSRISRGKIELTKERLELATIIHHAVETSKPFIEAANHRLTLRLPSEPVFVDGDLVRLSQVFANLLNNAAKYTQNSGNISVNLQKQDETAIVSIRDTGIGIPSHMLSRVFDMFTQVDNVLHRSQDGLGIGLSLVRTLVAMHDGSVEAQSAGLGQGSEFIVRLRLAEQQTLSTANTIQPGDNRATAPPTRRILVVDDNRDAADSLSMLLKFLGADVKVAYDGQTALEALRICRPSVLLLDLGMPGMDGYEVAQRVRRDPEFSHLTLIALTGWGQDQDRRRTQQAGFDHHLVKPVELDALQGLLVSLDSIAEPVECG
jgi:PAS domain S-box-containing protein